MIKHISCPECKFGRIIDADTGTNPETCSKARMKPDWHPDFYIKCPKCHKTIAIKNK